MRYKVKDTVISILLKNNTIAKAGQEIAEEQLTDSPANMIAGGYIEEIVEPGPSAADLQRMADEAKALEISNAKTAVEAATLALTTAQTNAETAAPELKEAADAAVVTAQSNFDTAQAAFDALVAPVSPAKNKK
jgi:hypothetical protein